MAGFIAAAVVSALGVTGVAAAVVSLGVTLVTSAVVSSLLVRRQDGLGGSAGPQVAQDTAGVRQQLSPQPYNRVPIVYGSAFMQGIVTDAKISADNQTMWYVITFTEVPESTSGNITFANPGAPYYGGNTPLVLWGDKQLIWDQGVPEDIDGSVISWRDTSVAEPPEDRTPDNNMNVYLYTRGSNSPAGNYGSAIDILSASDVVDPWDTTKLMSDVAFAIVKIKYNADKRITGLEPVTAYIQNSITRPGSVLVDYFTNTRYGAGVPTERLDLPSFAALDTFSDSTLSFSLQDGTTSEFIRYRIDGPVDTNREILKNLDDLTGACDSWLRWNEATAQWSVIINRSLEEAGLPVDSTRLITSSEIIGGVSIVPADLNQTVNSVEVAFPDRNNKDVTTYTKYVLDPQLRNPGEIDNELRVSLPQVNLTPRAYYLGFKRLAQTREDITIQFKMDYSGIQIDAGDIIRVQHEWYGWTDPAFEGGKLFWVSNVRETLDDTLGLHVEIEAFEYNDDVYDWQTLDNFSPSINSGIPDPLVLNAPANAVVTVIQSESFTPYFVVSCNTSNIGLATTTQLWIGPPDSFMAYTGNSNVSIEMPPGFSPLRDSWEDSSPNAVYTPNSPVSLTVRGYPLGLYDLAVRNSNPSGAGPSRLVGEKE